ncbi:hypothetical protein TYRP_009965, partial [Tyrophagus putrescentiae]
TFTEVVIDYPVEVPSSARQIPGQVLPPHFPNGWIPILESLAISANQIKSVLCFGVELAVVRGSSGQVYVLDAFCPHLGANFAVGGTVQQNDCKEDCIRCPFHGWSFRMTDGACTDIPYEEAPINAKVKLWESIEVNNFIFVWHHADGDAPSWKPENVPEIANKEWAYRGHTLYTVHSHIQETIENGADLAHLPEVHAAPIIGSSLEFLSKLKGRVIEHQWKVHWEAGEAPNSHRSFIKMVNYNKLLGRNVLTMNLDISQVGPAYIKLMIQTSFCQLKGAFMQFVTPQSPMKNVVTSHVYTERGILGYFLGKFLLFGEAKMLERDILIWNRKAYICKPLATKSEKSLVKFRRWYKQFYSKSNQHSIDW